MRLLQGKAHESPWLFLISVLLHLLWDKVALFIEMMAGPSWQLSQNRSPFCLEQPQNKLSSDSLHHLPTSAHLHQQKWAGALDYAERRVIIFLILLELFPLNFIRNIICKKIVSLDIFMYIFIITKVIETHCREFWKREIWGTREESKWRKEWRHLDTNHSRRLRCARLQGVLCAFLFNLQHIAVGKCCYYHYFTMVRTRRLREVK